MENNLIQINSKLPSNSKQHQSALVLAFLISAMLFLLWYVFIHLPHFTEHLNEHLQSTRTSASQSADEPAPSNSDEPTHPDQPANSNQQPNSNQQTNPDPSTSSNQQTNTDQPTHSNQQTSPADPLEDLYLQAKQLLTDLSLNERATTALTTEGIVITINEAVLFALGNAELLSNASTLLDRFAEFLRPLTHSIIIEGHTDDLALPTGSIYRDNWSFTSSRALSIFRYLVESKQINVSQLSYKGLAGTAPITDNTTAAGKQTNRRMEITIVR